MLIEFTPKAAKKVRDIRAKAGLASDEDVFKNAIRLYEYFVNAKADGCTFLVQNEDAKRTFDIVDGLVKDEDF